MSEMAILRQLSHWQLISTRMNELFSMRDRIFGTFATFNALCCFAVSLVLSLPSARERFLIALVIFLISLSYVEYKKTVA